MCDGTQQFVHCACLDNLRSVKEGFAFSNCTTCKAQFHLRVVELKDKTWRNIKFKLLVARDAFLVFLVVQILIGVFGAIAFLLDIGGNFCYIFNDTWEHLLCKHPIPLYYSAGVLALSVLVGISGLIYDLCVTDHCLTIAVCSDCWLWLGFVECVSALAIVYTFLGLALIVVFTIVGTIYGFFPATAAIYRSWQRHCDVLMKQNLTQEYVVEDVHGSSTRNGCRR